MRYTVYRDVAGYPTVGVGHLVESEDRLRVGDRISERRVLDFLDADLAEADRGRYAPRYQFGEAVLEGPELEIHADRIKIPGYEHAVSLVADNPFGSLDEETPS